MREAKPDDPIFKAGFIIGEKRLRNSPQDLTKLGKAKDKDTGKTPKQKERPIKEIQAD
jgi:hypothetical protein